MRSWKEKRVLNTYLARTALKGPSAQRKMPRGKLTFYRGPRPLPLRPGGGGLRWGLLGAPLGWSLSGAERVCLSESDRDPAAPGAENEGGGSGTALPHPTRRPETG